MECTVVAGFVYRITFQKLKGGGGSTQMLEGVLRCEVFCVTKGVLASGSSGVWQRFSPDSSDGILFHFFFTPQIFILNIDKFPSQFHLSTIEIRDERYPRRRLSLAQVFLVTFIDSIQLKRREKSPSCLQSKNFLIVE
ncbi:hypothetical protein DMENIID0001_159060 [Sergentomyia squamirostris]